MKLFNKKGSEAVVEEPKTEVKVVEAPLTIERVLEATRSGELSAEDGCALVFAVTDKDGNIQMGGNGSTGHVIGIAVNLIQQTGRLPEKQNGEQEVI